MIQHFTTKLIGKEQINEKIWQFTFELVDPLHIEFEAGQYMILMVPDINPGQPDKRRLYSIFSPQYIRNTFDLLVEMIPNGVGSTYLYNLQIGASAKFQGPAGLFTLKTQDKPKIYLATGTGIAPIYSQIVTLLKSNIHKDSERTLLDPHIILFWGLRTTQDMYYTKELLALASEYPHFRFYICLSREQTLQSHTFSKQGRNTSVLLSYFEAHHINLPSEYEYYVCGGREVVTEIQQFLIEKNIEKANIIAEKF